MSRINRTVLFGLVGLLTGPTLVSAADQWQLGTWSRPYTEPNDYLYAMSADVTDPCDYSITHSSDYNGTRAQVRTPSGPEPFTLGGVEGLMIYIPPMGDMRIMNGDKEWAICEGTNQQPVKTDSCLYYPYRVCTQQDGSGGGSGGGSNGGSTSTTTTKTSSTHSSTHSKTHSSTSSSTRTRSSTSSSTHSSTHSSSHSTSHSMTHSSTHSSISPTSTSKSSSTGISSSTTTTSKPSPTDESDKDVKEAESASAKFKDDPSADSASSLKHLIDTAIDSAKKALNTINTVAAKSATQDLIKDLQTADTAAAAAIEEQNAAKIAAVVATMEAVNKAQEGVEKARDDPRSVTVTSTVSTTSTSSTTSSSSACTPCKSCIAAEKRQAQATAAAFARKQRRAESRIETRDDTRVATICGTGFTAPSFESWHKDKTKTNPYTSYYSFRFPDTSQRCKLMDFELEVKKKDTVNKNDNFNTEHVYELQLLEDFLKWAVANDANIKAASQQTWDGFCRRIFNPIFGSTQKFPSSTKFSNGKQKPVDALVGQMSGGTAYQNEMVYLQVDLNQKKAKWSSDTGATSTFNTWFNGLEDLAFTSAMYQYLREPEITKTFKAVSARVESFYGDLDDAIAAAVKAGQVKFMGNVKFQAAYQDWVFRYFSNIDLKWEDYRQASLKNVQDKLATDTRGQSTLKSINDQIDTEKSDKVGTRPGYLSSKLFSVDDYWYVL
ncbi:hypothetical protein F5B20DRAFT_212342 [Whalleya microplaca]|nr:hypothetical protein F5B20DRAFT_212342 [Whalleya microplaca]